MGLYDLLTKNQATKLTKFFGNTPPLNPLGTKQSTMHAESVGGNTKVGYSLDGSLFPQTNKGYQQYDDGVNNPLPKSSVLDRDGKTPVKYSDLPHK